MKFGNEMNNDIVRKYMNEAIVVQLHGGKSFFLWENFDRRKERCCRIGTVNWLAVLLLICDDDSNYFKNKVY